MYAFPDISQDMTTRVARCSRVLGALLREANRQAETFAKDDYRTPSPDTQVAVEEKSNLKELLPDLPLAKFFALGAQLVVIEGLASQDLRFKTFYDLAGSGGQAGLAAVFLHRWSSVVCLESSVAKYDVAVLARRLVKRLNPTDLLTKVKAWTIEHTTFKKADWIDGDVLFFDALAFGTLDEGVLCRYLQGRLQALQAGSFVILFTCSSERLLTGTPFRLLYRQTVKHTEGGMFTSWLFKTTCHSTDHRVGVFDTPDHKDLTQEPAGDDGAGTGHQPSPTENTL